MKKTIFAVRVHYDSKGAISVNPWITNPAVLRKFKIKRSSLDALASAASTGAEHIEFCAGPQRKIFRFRKSYDSATPIHQ